MKTLTNIAFLAIAAFTFEACSSTRATSGSNSTADTSRSATRAGDGASASSMGNANIGGSTATASISGTAGNAMGPRPAGTMGTANTTSGPVDPAGPAVPNTAATTANGTAGAVTSGKKWAADDIEGWIKIVAISGMSEVQLSQLAIKNAQNSNVKQYAAMMVKDHGGANAELKALAAAKGITLPDNIRSAEKLGNSSGREFDQNYVKLMMTDHVKAVALFEQGSTSSDPQLKAYARKHLPTLKMHLQEISALSKKIGKTGGK